MKFTFLEFMTVISKVFNWPFDCIVLTFGNMVNISSALSVHSRRSKSSILGGPSAGVVAADDADERSLSLMNAHHIRVAQMESMSRERTCYLTNFRPHYSAHCSPTHYYYFLQLAAPVLYSHRVPPLSHLLFCSALLPILSIAHRGSNLPRLIIHDHFSPLEYSSII